MRELVATDVHVVCVVPCFHGQSVSKRKWHLQRSPAMTNILDHGSAEGDGERGEGGSGSCCLVFSGVDGLGVVVFRKNADLAVFVECLLSCCLRVCFFFFCFCLSAGYS